jgi:hypothetical protein
MNSNPKAVGDLIETMISALEEHAPNATFAGKTLPQIKQAVKPSLDARAQITDLEQQTATARVDRNNADPVSLELVQQVVNSIKGDPNYGENSALYAAIGYVRKDDRKSGLTRASKDEGKKAA